MHHLDSAAVGPLSSRQCEIIELAAHGYTDAAMAERLGISEGTIGTHWSRIRAKIGPYSRAELVAIGVRGELQEQMETIAEEREALLAQLQTIAIELTASECDSGCAAGLTVFDSDHRILYANRAMHRMLGYDVGELIGRRVEDICPSRIHEAVVCQHEELLTAPGVQTARDAIASGLMKNGEEILLQVTRSSVRCGDKVFVIGVGKRVIPGN